MWKVKRREKEAAMQWWTMRTSQCRSGFGCFCMSSHVTCYDARFRRHGFWGQSGKQVLSPPNCSDHPICEYLWSNQWNLLPKKWGLNHKWWIPQARWMVDLCWFHGKTCENMDDFFGVHLWNLWNFRATTPSRPGAAGSLRLWDIKRGCKVPDIFGSWERGWTLICQIARMTCESSRLRHFRKHFRRCWLYYRYVLYIYTIYTIYILYILYILYIPYILYIYYIYTIYIYMYMYIYYV